MDWSVIIYLYVAGMFSTAAFANIAGFGRIWLMCLVWPVLMPAVGIAALIPSKEQE